MSSSSYNSVYETKKCCTRGFLSSLIVNLSGFFHLDVIDQTSKYQDLQSDARVSKTKMVDLIWLMTLIKIVLVGSKLSPTGY